MQIKFNASSDSDRTHRRRDVVQVKYHKGLGKIWEKVETLAHNRKDVHFEKLSELEKKLEKKEEKQKEDLEKTRAARQAARRTRKGGRKDSKPEAEPVAA